MDTNFRFANLIGSVYRNGQVLFSPDGYSVLSPIGNKISIFDLKNNTSRTLALDCLYNITAMTLNHDGTHLVVVTEAGDIRLVNMATQTVIYSFRPPRRANLVEFSPDGKFLALADQYNVQIQAVGTMVKNMFRPLHMIRTITGTQDVITSIAWSDDGKLLLMTTEGKQIKVVAVNDCQNFTACSLASHRGAIVMAKFLKNSYDFVSVDVRGMANAWTTTMKPGDLLDGPFEFDKPEEERPPRLVYDKGGRCFVNESCGVGRSVDVVSAAFHPASNMLVCGLDNGVFVLHEVPTFALIHNLRASDIRISSIAISSAGDWLALGCGHGTSGQLVVWEWQSETYVMKQQSHSQRIVSAKFSPDGTYLATGAEDGKVKIWSNRNGFCTVTFDEHTSGVTGVAWTQSGRAILSSSLDGTVRAHDLKRYRNFRTLVCPEATQLGGLAVDAAGDLVVASSLDLFNVFVWSMETGRLLDVLAGHSSPISGISLNGTALLTCSSDQTFKIWNITDSSWETVNCSAECLAIEFSPCGTLIAVITLDNTITFYTKDARVIGTIDASLDLDAARSMFEQTKKQKSEKNKCWTTMTFSPDGSLLLVGGDTNHFCLYSVPDRMLVNKFKITENRSLDGVVLDVNRRNYSEFGNMQLCDDEDSDDGGVNKPIKLAGTVHSDKGERAFKPQIAVFNVSYCPTGRRFAICSTEGVAVYSLDTVSLFDPFQLDSSSSPDAVRRFLSMSDYLSALMCSLRLNDGKLIARCCQKTPLVQVDLVAHHLPLVYAEKLLKWIADGEVVWNSPHIHFYMVWVRAVVRFHGVNLKGRTDLAILTGVQQIVNHHRQLIEKLAEQNKFGLKYLVNARKLKRKTMEVEMDTEECEA